MCLEITGVTPGPPEDPNAAPPPADGSAVTADVFRTTSLAGRSKWKDQKVAVSGVFGGASTSTAGAGVGAATGSGCTTATRAPISTSWSAVGSAAPR